MMRMKYGSERIQMHDQETGIKVIQITSFPIQSVHLDYGWPSVTPDNRRFIFCTQQYAGRAAPWDILRCDTDGFGLFQLTDREFPNPAIWHYGIPKAAMTLDGERLYAVWPGENILCRIDVETGETEELADLNPYLTEGHLPMAVRISSGERRIFVDIRSYEHGGAFVLRLDLSSGELVHMLDGRNIHACFSNEERILVQTNFVKLDTEETDDGTRKYSSKRQEKVTFVSCDEDGGDERYVCDNNFAHSTLLGRTGKVQGTGLPPERCIWVAGEGIEPYRAAVGPYFWHSGASFDGEWIISDTNWPDNGLHLIHVPTGHFRTLCHARASQEHSQLGHPHPALSQDGRIAVFGSDRTGVSQVYIALITNEFRESVIAGELNNPKDKWI